MRQVGGGKFRYQEWRGWGQFPEGWAVKDAAGVAVDSQDRIYVLTRWKHGLLVFDREGRFLQRWPEGLCTRPHGMFIGPDDAVYIVDDLGHAVLKYAADGELLMTIETGSHPADTGYEVGRFDTVVRAGPPFNYPTGVALSPEGDLYVSDGYGNARVHKFAPDGRLLFSWGEPGSGPGQFITVHGVWVDPEGLVYVSDRMNLRVQIFTPQGEYVGQWDGLRFPNNLCMDGQGHAYVVEMGNDFVYRRGGVPDRVAAGVSVLDGNGQVLAEWSEPDPFGAGIYFAPHSIAVDSQGDLYVSEVAGSYSADQTPSDWGVVRKYVRI